MISLLKINLACGAAFVEHEDWLNLDFAPASPAVRKADLLGRLPVADGAAALVYSSHFLEHVPRDMVPGFLRECHRVLRPGGVLRLVPPDLENMAREYLARREADEHEKADFVVMELIDQCVRRESGGELGRLYRRLAGGASEGGSAMIEYIRERTGEDLRPQSISSGGIFPGSRLGSPALASHSGVDSLGSGCVAESVPGAERQPRGGGRTASLAVGFPPAQGGPGGGRLRGCAAAKRLHQRGAGLPLLSARRGCRRAAAQGGGVDVRGGMQTMNEGKQ